MLPYRETLYGMDIGKDAGPTVTDAYEGPFPFAGRLDWVRYHLEDDRDDLTTAAAVEHENSWADQ